MVIGAIDNMKRHGFFWVFGVLVYIENIDILDNIGVWGVLDTIQNLTDCSIFPY